jgi:hypothetical protein
MMCARCSLSRNKRCRSLYAGFRSQETLGHAQAWLVIEAPVQLILAQKPRGLVSAASVRLPVRSETYTPTIAVISSRFTGTLKRCFRECGVQSTA